MRHNSSGREKLATVQLPHAEAQDPFGRPAAVAATSSEAVVEFKKFENIPSTMLHRPSTDSGLPARLGAEHQQTAGQLLVF